MKVTSLPDKAFRLEMECAADQALLDALYVERAVVVGKAIDCGPMANGARTVKAFVLHVDRQHPQQLVADAGRQVLRSLGDLLRLGLREAASHGHIRTDTADPQPQEALAASLEQVQHVAQALGLVVGQREIVVEKGLSSHGSTSAASVATGGTP